MDSLPAQLPGKLEVAFSAIVRFTQKQVGKKTGWVLEHCIFQVRGISLKYWYGDLIHIQILVGVD